MIAVYPSIESGQQSNGSAAAPPETNSSSKPLALVVEDHDDTRSMLRFWLEQRGYRVAEAADGGAAVQLAEEADPNVVLMDVKLPVLDGFAAAYRIRRFAGRERMPIIFLTAHAEPQFRATALAVGADHYLVKPFDLNRLQAMLDQYLCALLPAAERGGR